jgi:hypothetical protein
LKEEPAGAFLTWFGNLFQCLTVEGKKLSIDDVVLIFGIVNCDSPVRRWY